MNATNSLLRLHSDASVARDAADGLAAIVLPRRRASCRLGHRAPRGAARASALGRFPVTIPALALRRERVQMSVRVTVPAPASAAAKRFPVSTGRASGIIIAVPHSHAPPPNPSFERTQQRDMRQTGSLWPCGANREAAPVHLKIACAGLRDGDRLAQNDIRPQSIREISQNARLLNAGQAAQFRFQSARRREKLVDSGGQERGLRHSLRFRCRQPVRAVNFHPLHAEFRRSENPRDNLHAQRDIERGQNLAPRSARFDGRRLPFSFGAWRRGRRFAAARGFSQ